MFEDPNTILGVGGIVIGLAGAVAASLPTAVGYLEKKRKDEAEEAARRRTHEIREAILMNDLVRDATAGQETTAYARKIRALAAGEQPPKE